MSLTKQDLTAIEKLIQSSSDGLESRLIARIDDFDDTLSIQMEHGLLEIRDDISSVKVVVDRIDRVQQAEITRNDKQDADIKQIRKSLRTA
jgi:DnaJ-domain-containing protein 1